MSTIYSDEVAVGTYNRIRIKCDYSGTSATLTIQFRRTQAYTSTWASDYATLTFNGQSQNANYSYSGTVGTSWIDLKSISGYTIPSAGGTFNWSFVDNAVLGCSGTIAIPAQGSAPSAGYINNLAVSYNGTELEFSSTSVGVNDGGLTLDLNRFEICEVPLTQSGIPAQIKSFTNGQPITLKQSDSTAHDGGITIVGNHLYYSGLAARNSAGLYYYNGPSIITPCVPATITLDAAIDYSVTIAYSIVADGGYYDKTIEYSLDNGDTWTTAVTITGGAAQSGTFTITGLTPSTSYTLKTRAQTTAGTTNNTDLTFTTSAANPQARLYGSASGDTTRVASLYGPVSDVATRIIKLYGPEQVTTLTYTVTDIANNTGFDATTFMSKYNTEYGDLTKEPGTLLVGETPAGSGSMKAFLYDSNNTMINLLFDWTKYSYNDEGLVWGFASEPASGTVTSTSTTQTSYQTKRIY